MFSTTFRNVVPSIIGYILTVLMVVLTLKVFRSLFSSSPIHQGKSRGPYQHAFVPRTLVQQRDPEFDVRRKIEEMNTKKVAPDNPDLIHLIKNYYLEVPSAEPYNLEFPNKVDYFYGQTPYIDARLDFMETGFYIETRAFEGETSSVSLFFEKYRYWEGLLVEPNPEKFNKLRTKNRKAFLLNGCIHDKPYPAKVLLQTSSDLSESKMAPYQAQCFPLLSILLALEQKEITLLSLNFYETDAGSDSEHSLVSIIPYDYANITFITIRNFISNRGPKGPTEDVLESHKFELLDRLKTENMWVNDLIFHNTKVPIPNPVFWTWTNIFRAIVVFVILYGIANVVVYKYYFKRTHLYRRYLAT